MTEEGQDAPDLASDAQAPKSVARAGSSRKFGSPRLSDDFPGLPRERRCARAVAASFGWFPLVGFALGATLAAENLLLTPFFGDALAAILLVLTLTVLTGALHLDGLADTADALGAGTIAPCARDHARQPDRDLRRGRDLLRARA